MKQLARQLVLESSRRLARVEPPSPRDAIAILGCALRPGGEPTRALRERLDTGISLHRRGLAPRVLVSGGRVWHGHVEAEAMARELIQGGVAEDALILEPRSRNTRDNGRLGAAALRAAGARSALIVTQPLHLPRAVRAFSLAGIEAGGVLIEQSYQLDLDEPRALLRDLVRELAGTAVDLLLRP